MSNNVIMNKNLRFVKNDLEENLKQFLSETLAAQPRRFNADPGCPESERFRYNTNNNQHQHNNNTEIFETRKRCQNVPATFKSYGGFSNEYRNPNYVNDDHTEYISYKQLNNNPIENRLSNEHVMVYNNNNSENLNFTKIYDDNFSSNYRNEDQLRNNTMFALNRRELRNDKTFADSENMQIFRGDTLHRNETQFGGNISNFGPSDNGITNYSNFSDYQRPSMNNSIPRNSIGFNDNIKTADAESRNFECFSRNIDVSQYHYQTKASTKNGQPKRNDQSHIYETFSRDNGLERKFNSNSKNKRQFEKLDDGFVCVRNPEYFPVQRRDDERYSRENWNEEEQYRSIDIPKKSHASSYNRGGSLHREEHEFEKCNNFDIHKKRTREAFIRNFRDDRHVNDYESQRNKYKTANKAYGDKSYIKHTGKKEVKVLHSISASYKKNRKNNHRNDDLPHSSRYTSSKQSTTRIDPKRISTVEPHPYSTNIKRKTTQTSKKSKIDKQLILRNLKKYKRKAIVQQRKNAKEKTQEIADAELPKQPSTDHIKTNPETYWKEWWSKYAYIETAIEKVDAEDEAVKQFLKVNYDIKKIDLDSKVSGDYTLGLKNIKQAANINEKNYEHRTDVFEALKYKKILEDKEFQAFLLTRELEVLKRTLQSLTNNRKLLSLLYQSIICRWHISMRLVKSEESGTAAQVKHANTLINDKLFHYLVLDSIHELKKLTKTDWKGFGEFYNNLQ